jgi:uncharacterized protein YjiS (DUF1127 family)
MAHIVTTAQGSFQSTDQRPGNPGLVARLRKALADYRLYRRTLAELESLSDRELRDLDLSRFSLREIAYDSVYGG